MKTPITEIVKYFENLGWEKGRPPVTSRSDQTFYNRFSGYPECGNNPGKGILVYAVVYDYSRAPVPSVSIELHLTGQIGQEQWADLHVYSIDNLDQIPVCCERLLKAWKTMNEVQRGPA